MFHDGAGGDAIVIVAVARKMLSAKRLLRLPGTFCYPWGHPG